MITVYKYELFPAKHQALEIKGLLHLLSAIEQRGKIVIYAAVDTDSLKVSVVDVCVLGTGHEASIIADERSQFLGSVKIDDGLVFHIFVVARDK